MWNAIIDVEHHYRRGTHAPPPQKYLCSNSFSSPVSPPLVFRSPHERAYMDQHAIDHTSTLKLLCQASILHAKSCVPIIRR